MAAVAGSAIAGAQALSARETTLSVRRALERLPYYGVFDFLSFRLDRGAVVLEGYAYHANLGSDALHALKRVSGVDEIANRVESLPASQNDDRIRWQTFYRIYSDDFLSRYASGGTFAARRAAYESARFPGLQPSGLYAIHIVVKGGRTTLMGMVDNKGDRRLAEIRAREVSGVFGVDNQLVTAK
jgi:osmotically-inducible protein OsmY